MPTSCRRAARSRSTAKASPARSQAAIEAEPLIELRREEVAALPDGRGPAIVATGPLTSPALAASIRAATGEEALAFFDAIAPIVHRDTIDLERRLVPVALRQGRPRRRHAPTTSTARSTARSTRPSSRRCSPARPMRFKDWERATPYFEGCLPIEVMAGRGPETLRFGPMKPVGLTDPRSGQRPYAVVQLRQDNALGTLFNMVGFQTKLSHGEQKRIFRMIPGLERAEFARLGGLHRNTFINSPRLLDAELRLKARPHLRFAGQITGVEGYVESAAIGILAGRFAAAELAGRAPRRRRRRRRRWVPCSATSPAAPRPRPSSR